MRCRRTVTPPLATYYLIRQCTLISYSLSTKNFLYGEHPDALQECCTQFLVQIFIKYPKFHALYGLKEKHKKILFARLFGELTFQQIGEKFGMTEKQAEAVYFYVITKLRKEMEGKRDEF